MRKDEGPTDRGAPIIPLHGPEPKRSYLDLWREVEKLIEAEKGSGRRRKTGSPDSKPTAQAKIIPFRVPAREKIGKGA